MTEQGIPPKLDTDAERRAAIPRFGGLLVRFAGIGGAVSIAMWLAGQAQTGWPHNVANPNAPPPPSRLEIDAGDASRTDLTKWPTAFPVANGVCVDLLDASIRTACGSNPDLRILVAETAPDGGAPFTSPAGTWLAPCGALNPPCPVGQPCGVHRYQPPDGICQ